MGNGFPVAAVITTPELARSFAAGGLEYFNTFGGNPVAGAVAAAVLDVIEREGLQARAARVGAVLLEGFRALYDKYAAPPLCVGSVRGVGLMVGLEFIRGARDGAREHDGEGATAVKNACYCNRRVLVSTDGMFDQVIKLKPPMCFSEDDAREACAALDEAMGELRAARLAAMAK
jgi:4-aminobutyrate aminotransferase-like enzyme